MGVGIMSDGTLVLVYHPELVDKTDEDNLLYVIEHELLHLLNKHPVRALRLLVAETDPIRLYFKQRILNIASDCAVNAQGRIPKELTIGGKPWKLHFAKNHKLPEKLTSEAMYYMLLEREEQKAEERKKKNKERGGTEEKQIMFIPGVGVVEVDPNGIEDPIVKGFGNPNEKEAKQKGSDISDNESPDGQGDEAPNVDYHGAWTVAAGKSSDIGALTRKCDASITNVIRESVRQFEKRRGTLPGGYAELIAQALEPPLAPYYQIISRYVRATKITKFKRSPVTINRKRTYVFKDDNIPMISPFPGRKRDFSFKVGVLLDTSGSMSPEEIREGLSGTKHLIEKDRYTDTTILEVDTAVEKEYKCKRIRDIQFSVKGRGGTTLGAGFFRAKELNVDVLLVFTDAMTENINAYPRRELPKKMIFVVPEKAKVDTIKGLGPIVRIKK
jgi:predicted metal-dependent peptidase